MSVFSPDLAGVEYFLNLNSSRQFLREVFLRTSPEGRLRALGRFIFGMFQFFPSDSTENARAGGPFCQKKPCSAEFFRAPRDETLDNHRESIRNEVVLYFAHHRRRYFVYHGECDAIMHGKVSTVLPHI